MDAVHSIDELLSGMDPLGASDLHLAAGSPPVIRVHGDLHPITELPELTSADT